jgi:hypothetical protein
MNLTPALRNSRSASYETMNVRLGSAVPTEWRTKMPQALALSFADTWIATLTIWFTPHQGMKKTDLAANTNSTVTS